MSKTSNLKPGQVRKIGAKMVRCAKRELGCHGCVLDSLALCPRLGHDSNVTCIEDGVIFVSVIKNSQ